MSISVDIETKKKTIEVTFLREEDFNDANVAFKTLWMKCNDVNDNNTQNKYSVIDNAVAIHKFVPPNTSHSYLSLEINDFVTIFHEKDGWVKTK
jgi:cupin superfamily acireductone dioxygenase involved in methionine salvage